MGLDSRDTKLILELATFAAKAVVKEATSEVFERMNAVHDKQISRIDSAVALLSKTNEALVKTTAEVKALSKKVEESVDGAAAKDIARELVDECSERHTSSRRWGIGTVISVISASVAVGSAVMAALTP